MKPRSPAAKSKTSGPPIIPIRLIAKAEIILDQKFYKVSYNEDHRLANWVSYSLEAENLTASRKQKRSSFVSDMTLMKMRIPYAEPQDLEGREYDRVSLAPVKDFSWDAEASQSTVIMSNVVPMKVALSRGPWKKLEDKTRAWACNEGRLQVITGPVLSRSLAKFPSKVSTPQQFYKILVSHSEPKKVIGFIFNQNDKKLDLEKQATTLFEIEKLTGTLYGNESGLNREEYLRLRMEQKLSDWAEGSCSGAKSARLDSQSL